MRLNGIQSVNTVYLRCFYLATLEAKLRLLPLIIIVILLVNCSVRSIYLFLTLFKNFFSPLGAGMGSGGAGGGVGSFASTRSDLVELLLVILLRLPMYRSLSASILSSSPPRIFSTSAIVSSLETVVPERLV